ncbi:MAG: ATP-dependent Clp protease ATP-binding subunit [Firmicutes bacterium]|nr:ATP-dependent Clp protease ATP-binding subunit [Bacillota bacterium]
MLRFSEDVNNALKAAQQIAYKYSSGEVGTEHVIYGLAFGDGVAGKILRENGVTTGELEKIFVETGDGMVTLGKMDLSPRVKHSLLFASQIAQNHGASFVDTQHLLFCLLQDPNSYGYKMLSSGFGCDVNKMSGKLATAFGAGGVGGNFGAGGGNIVQGAAQSGLPPQLKDLGIDVTQKARENKIDPIIGRSEEIERIIQILCRKTKNNPVLIGEPGVGKSAIIEGLAKAIVENKVPDILSGKIVFALDIASLMAGTKYRGALEEKLKEAVEIIKSQGNIITFIDELHTLAMAGSDKGEVSPADMLKPYLARGEFQTIGATTTDEYRKFIEKDKALERRFQPIIVEPPSVADTISIIKGLRDNYEAFHKVKLSDEAIEASVTLSDRYIMDRFLPDKAIDLIDEAMSKAKIGSSATPPQAIEYETKLKDLESQLNQAKANNDFEKCLEISERKKEVTAQIDKIKLAYSKSQEMSATIDGEDIAKIVAKWTKIPVTKLSETEKDRLVNLEKLLHERVVGQDGAVSSVAKAVRRARAGLKDPKRPIGSFIFLGPTGVGKTELTKALTEAMFDSENNIVRLDMSEYMESHSVSKLIGAPPGYIGHDDGGQLTEAVRRRPYSVVLFDEIEKAHPDVYNALLQILDEGRLTDSQGRVVNFKNTIIIMTSNVGIDQLKKVTRSLGFGDGEEKVKQKDEEVLMNALKNRFKPEFLNRIDVVCIFHYLSEEHIRKIATIMLKSVKAKLKERGIDLQLTDSAFEYVVNKGFDGEYGARPLRRVIEQKIEDSLAEALLMGAVKEKGTVTVDIGKDGVVEIK